MFSKCVQFTIYRTYHENNLSVSVIDLNLFIENCKGVAFN